MNTRKNFIDAYVNANRQLASSLIVKFAYAAMATNRAVEKAYGTEAVDRYQPESWKYYMNLAGEYHPTDTPMTVVSLDTREEILFSPDNLRLHTATAEGYRQGSRYYRRLVLEYPDQQFLINCILTPANKQQAIDAPDGTILAYDQLLVEEFETTLISDLQAYFYNMQDRWNTEAYALSDPYYASMQAACLAAVTLPKLLNLRDARRKTDEVHSFHLREYLASHQRLDVYLPYLTREQALWLYRNIKYIHRHGGHTETFNTLLEQILNKRMIPLAEYTIRQFGEFTIDSLPITMARRRTISRAEMAGDFSYVTLEGFYNKEVKTAPGNERFFQVAEQRITHQLKTTDSSVLQTKDLESSMIDLSNSVPDPLPDVLLRQWVSMTHMGLYNAIIHFQDPLTAEQRSLASFDAIIYMYYLTCKLNKIPFETLPTVATVKFRLHPRPPVEELTRLIEPGMEWLRPIAEELVTAQPVFTELYSVSMFQQVARQVYEECLRHWYLTSGTYDIYTRGVLEQMTLKLFGSALYDFSNGEDTEVWRVRNNLPPYDYTYEQANNLIQELFTRATGYQIDDARSLRNVQNALINLFSDLSSYSIQFIREINDNQILLGGPNHTRYGNVREYSENFLKHMPRTTYDGASFVGADRFHVRVGELDGQEVLQVTINDKLEMQHHIDMTMDSFAQDPLSAYGRPLSMPLYIETADPVTGEIKRFPASSPELFLTPEQYQNLKFLKDFQ